MHLIFVSSLVRSYSLVPQLVSAQQQPQPGLRPRIPIIRQGKERDDKETDE